MNSPLKYQGIRGRTRSLAKRSKAKPDRWVREWDRNQAVTMWMHGCDTHAIGLALNLPEYRVYNELPKWRLEE